MQVPVFRRQVLEYPVEAAFLAAGDVVVAGVAAVLPPVAVDAFGALQEFDFAAIEQLVLATLQAVRAGQ